MPQEILWQPALARGLKMALVALMGHVAIRLGYATISRIWGRYENRARDPRRINTLVVLFKSVLRYVVDFIVFVTILEMLDINTGSVIAGAGIAGLAVGFGAQNFVKDLIAGFFIIFEDQFAVGEFVSVAGINGTVVEVGLRVTKVRTFRGELHSIPNGAIDRSMNMSRLDSMAYVNIPVGPNEKVDQVVQLLQRVAGEIKNKEPSLIDGPNVLGPTDITEKGFAFSIIAKTPPLGHWRIEREIRAAVKRAFEQEGIEFATYAVLTRKE